MTNSNATSDFATLNAELASAQWTTGVLVTPSCAPTAVQSTARANKGIRRIVAMMLMAVR